MQWLTQSQFKGVYRESDASDVKSGATWTLGGLVVLAVVLRSLESRVRAWQRQQRRQRYQSYLRSPQWYARRQVALAKAGRRCRDCGRPTAKLQVHHLTYKRIFREHPKDLRALCWKCHKRHHRRGQSGFDRLMQRLTN